MVYARFALSLAELVLYTQVALGRHGKGVKLASVQICYVDQARNALVDWTEGEWLFQTDTDHVFDGNLLIRMLNVMYEHDLQVLSALYFARHTHQPHVYSWTDDTHTAADQVTGLPHDRLLQVDAVGAGCLLVRRDVFNRIQGELGRKPFAQVGCLGEDLQFCANCAELGIPIHVHTGLLSRHIEARALDWDDHERTGERPD